MKTTISAYLLCGNCVEKMASLPKAFGVWRSLVAHSLWERLETNPLSLIKPIGKAFLNFKKLILLCGNCVENIA